MVGDGDAVGVSSEVAEDLLGSAEGGLGVDDPVFLVEMVTKRCPCPRMGEVGSASREIEHGVFVRVVEGGEKLPPEKPAEHLNRQEVALTPGDPALCVKRQPTTGDDAVQMRVEQEILPPGVQEGGRGDLRAEVVGVASYLLQGLRRRVEEKRVGNPLIS